MNDEKIPDAVKAGFELLNCPFCGAKPDHDHEQWPDGGDAYAIWCANHGCMADVEVKDHTRADAIESWNGRAPAPQAAAEVPSLASAPLPQEQQDAIQKLCDAEGVISPADCGDSLGNWAKAVLIARRDTIAARDAAQATAERLTREIEAARTLIETLRHGGAVYGITFVGTADAWVTYDRALGAASDSAKDKETGNG